MQKLFLLGAAALAFVACSKQASIESVESLVADPARLKELRAQCKANHAKVGDAQCNAVAEATRRRFMGGGTPYTPAQAPAPAASAVQDKAP
ncbi:lipoprotein [Alicycliphilus sp. B1]|nr:lipoprotein [Alicycliphilus sp. B1]